MATAVDLFTGVPRPSGGLSNEKELAAACPAEFKIRNDWSSYAGKLFFEGGKVSNWKWKSSDDAERTRQRRCFGGLLATFDLGHHEKEAVAGWMLSEMLTEVPEHIPA